jgi:hypothetical protein
MSEPLEVSFLSPGRFSRLSGHEVTIVVTDTGRTYQIIENQWACYIDPVTGDYRGQSANFMRWLLDLEKSKKLHHKR